MASPDPWRAVLIEAIWISLSRESDGVAAGRRGTMDGASNL